MLPNYSSYVPCFEKPNLKILIWSKERFIDGEGAPREDGGPCCASDSSFLLDQAKGF